MLAAALLAGFTGLAGAPAVAQDGETESATELERKAEEGRERAKELREKAAELKAQVRALRSKSVTVARRAQELEAELSQLEARLAELEARESDKRAALRDRRAQLAETLAALQRIAVQPPEAMVMSSRSPLDVVRGAMVLGETVPAIESRARELRGDLVELRRVREEIAKQREQLQATKAELADQRQRLSKVMARKNELRRQLVGRSQKAEERADALARKAENMRDLVSRLRSRPDPPEPSPDRAEIAPSSDGEPAPGADETDSDGSGGDGEASEKPVSTDADLPPRPESKPRDLVRRTVQAERRTASVGSRKGNLNRPKDIRAFPDSRESLRMPASGQVVTKYGEEITRAGGTTAAKGIVIRTRDGAPVVAPYDGKVAYAGPFEGYGRILIIEHGERYHSLLAGLDRIDAIVGQWVLAGEPVGVMSDAPSQPPELYMELRRTGRPVNPLPWLAQTGNKVKG